MMYYKTQKALMEGGIIDSVNPEWFEDIKKQLCWAKGSRHKITNLKMVEPKKDIKDRVGHSPDVADGLVLLEAYEVLDKLPDNETSFDPNGRPTIGGGVLKMPEFNPEDLYNEYENND
jgi:hypothetical protein